MDLLFDSEEEDSKTETIKKESTKARAFGNLSV